MLPDWLDPTFAMARQYPAPGGVIITPGSPAQMRVGGRLVPAMPVDAAAYPAGTQVKPVQLGAEWFFLPSTSKYPASYIEPLSAWAERSREALFLKYILERSNCAQHRVYSRGRVVAVANEYQLTVICWDGVTRQLPVDYMGSAGSNGFASGDTCLVYDSGTQKIVLGRLGSPVLGFIEGFQGTSITVPYNAPFTWEWSVSIPENQEPYGGCTAKAYEYIVSYIYIETKFGVGGYPLRLRINGIEGAEWGYPDLILNPILPWNYWYKAELGSLLRDDIFATLKNNKAYSINLITDTGDVFPIENTGGVVFINAIYTNAAIYRS